MPLDSDDKKSKYFQLSQVTQKLKATKEPTERRKLIKALKGLSLTDGGFLRFNIRTQLYRLLLLEDPKGEIDRKDINKELPSSSKYNEIIKNDSLRSIIYKVFPSGSESTDGKPIDDQAT